MLTTLSLLVGLSTVQAAPIPACNRSASMIAFLEKTLSLPCEQITDVDLARIKDEALPSGFEAPVSFTAYGPLQAGDFSGLVQVKKLNFGVHFKFEAFLPAGVFAGMSALEEIELRSSHPTSFVIEGTFDGLPSLKQIKFNNFPLKTIPARLFVGAPQLKKVSFFNNGTTAVDPNVFEKADSLEDVSLIGCCGTYGNRLQKLPSQFFYPLVNLKSLDLRELGLTRISSHAFDRNKKLRRLDLSTQQLKYIPDNLFKNQTALEYLDLSLVVASNFYVYYDLSKLNLKQSTELKTLKLMGSGKIDDSFIQSLADSLQELTIAGFIFDFVGDEPFSHLRNLSHLELTNLRGLIRIGRCFFKGLNNLKELLLIGNRLSEIQEGSFDSLSSVESIDLVGNAIRTLPLSLFSKADRLRRVILLGNPFFDKALKDVLSTTYPKVRFEYPFEP